MFVLVWFLTSLATATASEDCHATAFICTAYRDRSGAENSVKAEIAAFADGYASPATGLLVRAGDGFGDMGCSLPWKRPDAGPWIALVRRGGCSVEAKIANAVHQGANGIIIYNNRDSLSRQNLRVTRKYQTLISVVFTYKWKGEELATLLDYGLQIVAELSVANPCIAIDHGHERNMQLVSISFLCFIVLTISLAWLIFYYVQRYRFIQARERKSRGYSEADEKALKSIPTKTLKSNDKLIKDESECCAICIDPYRQSEVVRTLVCSHEFHKDCIDPWLLENKTCPMCKKDILLHPPSSCPAFLGSQESIIQVVADEALRLAPSSPEITIVVVANRRTPTPLPSPLRSPVTSDVDILTERVQPTNRDAACFAGSCSSLLTVDSAQEALQLIDSEGENPKTALMSSKTSRLASSCPQRCKCCPQTSKTVLLTTKTNHETSNCSQACNCCPQASKTAISTTETPLETSKTAVTPEKNLETSNSSPESSESLLDSCSELRETDDESPETRPSCVNDDDNPLLKTVDADDVENDTLLQEPSSENLTTDSENS